MRNNTDYGEILRDKYSGIYLSNSICIVIGTLIGIFGNCVVIFVYLFRIKERGERYFIPLLAIVDLIGCFVSCPFYIMDNTFYYNYPSDIVCRIFTFLQAFVAGFSAHILVVICVQRYLLVCKPLGPTMTLFRKKVSFTTALFLSLVYITPLLAISGIKTTDELFLNHTVQTTLCKYYAEDTSASITAYFGFLGLISVVNIIITAALFIPVLRRINISFSGKKWKNVYHINQDSNTSSNTESISQSNKTCSIDSYTHNYVPNQIKPGGIGVTKCISNPDVNYKKKEFLNIRSNKEPSPDDVENGTSFDNTTKSDDIVPSNNETNPEVNSKTRKVAVKRRITIMYFVIIITYILSYIPSLLILILAYAIGDFNVITLTAGETFAWTYFSHFVFLNHIVNPFIYSYFDVKFRTELKTCFMYKR
ncbi:Hypothetical predicted protein [Mytilus galloprovincialis]|uniref:G-protein coupled receptors family 1 profile domain-containing protein n=1 Tax=Mytilus galloprovincialis TaxID=29158 RepID=A0A8B6BVS1_MYTGA|nr:Hypothetical predicted protein [Mytilus galloprovincialis]